MIRQQKKKNSSCPRVSLHSVSFTRNSFLTATTLSINSWYCFLSYSSPDQKALDYDCILKCFPLAVSNFPWRSMIHFELIMNRVNGSNFNLLHVDTVSPAHTFLTPVKNQMPVVAWFYLWILKVLWWWI